MSTVEIQDGEFKDLGREFPAAGGLVLPEEVVADLAGQLVARARAGEPVRLTEAGPVRVAVPRDRAGTFEPVLVPRGERRTSGITGVVTSLYASGLSVRDIARHLDKSMGVELPPDTISRITDEVLDQVKAWQSRPLDAVCPVVFIDAMMAKVRDGSSVRSKAVNVAIGVGCEGVKRVLGIWVAAAEGCGTPTGSFRSVPAAA